MRSQGGGSSRYRAYRDEPDNAESARARRREAGGSLTTGPSLVFKIQSRMCFELDQRFRSSADVKAAFG
ncbi:hypothetical protein GZL_00438 [Streptomyces sp. 769]|nr:hypothetical protein GZL_00438 [Streptomyces sp. 769]